MLVFTDGELEDRFTKPVEGVLKGLLSPNAGLVFCPNTELVGPNAGVVFCANTELVCTTEGFEPNSGDD